VTFVDEDLLGYETVWAAAGTPFAVFEVPTRDLAPATGGTLIDLKKV
jgi:prolyl-tRNA editing enzyme YbaK/EbsC (Cys-tRNA(Pro) deacylase)